MGKTIVCGTIFSCSSLDIYPKLYTLPTVTYKQYFILLYLIVITYHVDIYKHIKLFTVFYKTNNNNKIWQV